jgi:hypothetical protein
MDYGTTIIASPAQAGTEIALAGPPASAAAPPPGGGAPPADGAWAGAPPRFPEQAQGLIIDTLA